MQRGEPAESRLQAELPAPHCGKPQKVIKRSLPHGRGSLRSLRGRRANKCAGNKDPVARMSAATIEQENTCV